MLSFIYKHKEAGYKQNKVSKPDCAYVSVVMSGRFALRMYKGQLYCEYPMN